MKNTILKSAEFRTSIADIGTYKTVAASDTLPEICVVGRSNVGKSSVINLIAGRKNLAKTSSTPGRTRLINVFDFCLKISGEETEVKLVPFALIDLPGYGYAKASKTLKAGWATLIDEYFRESKKIGHVLSLVDIRHPPSELDKQMISYLASRNIGFSVIATKADKVANSQKHKHIQMLASELAIGSGNIITTSTLSGVGKQEVLDRLGMIVL